MAIAQFLTSHPPEADEKSDCLILENVAISMTVCILLYEVESGASSVSMTSKKLY